MTRNRRILLAGASVFLLSCSDEPTGPVAESGPVLPGLLVSNPTQIASATGSPGDARAVLAGVELVYVSLPPGSLPSALTGEILNTSVGGPLVITPVIDGGFDPVAVPASAGDRLELTFRGPTGTVTFVASVATRRPPIIVRTYPPRGRTDVALNVIPTVIFSEPVTVESASEGIHLLAGGAQVSGSVRLRKDEPWVAEFVPTGALLPSIEYGLQVSGQVRDLDGDPVTPATVTFTTGESVAAIVAGYDRITPSFIPGTQRYVLFENGRFRLEYSRPDWPPFAYAGSYARNGEAITFAFDGWNTAGPWNAGGTIRGDTLTVQYNAVMGLADFEDGVYVRSVSGGPFSVSGFITQRIDGASNPLPGTNLWAWVQMPTNGYVLGPVTSGAAGNFGFDLIPGGTVMIEAWNARLDQPCASTVTLGGSNATVDVEVTSVDAPIVMEQPQAPALIGVVTDGSGPVAGARVFYDIFGGMGLIAATTTTDANGRYTLCRLPAIGSSHVLQVWKSGYRLEEILVSVSGVTELDVQLKQL